MRNKFCLAALTAILLIGLGGCTPAKDDTNPVTSNPTTLSLSVEARPQTLRADGSSRLVVFVEMHRGEQAVTDSTQVILLNTIGTLGKGVVFTRDGVALDTLTSDTVAATGWLIAYAAGVRDSVEILFTTVP
jgi:hypothetical protein